MVENAESYNHWVCRQCIGHDAFEEYTIGLSGKTNCELCKQPYSQPQIACVSHAVFVKAQKDKLTNTPGPWEVTGAGNYIGVSSPAGQIVEPYTVSTSEGKANLSLIAAAPDLLAALEDIVKRNEIQNWFNLNQANQAIAKARSIKDAG